METDRADSTEALERCTRQRAQTAVRRQKSLSSRPTDDRFTAEIASRSTRNSKNYVQRINGFCFFSFFVINSESDIIFINLSKD